MMQESLDFIRTDVQVAAANSDQFLEGFVAWMLTNEHIWRAFKREADKVWNRGRRHYSARTIIEVLRHESTLREVDGEFKISNNVAPDFARLYVIIHPERCGLFAIHARKPQADAG